MCVSHSLSCCAPDGCVWPKANSTCAMHSQHFPGLARVAGEVPELPQLILACREQQSSQQGQQTAFPPCLPFAPCLSSHHSPGPRPCGIHFSRAFPGFGSPPAASQAGMSWDEHSCNPTLAMLSHTPCHPRFPLLPFTGCCHSWVFCVSPPHRTGSGAL